MNARQDSIVPPQELPPALVLASASPRRRELLWQIGVAHRIAIAGVDETPRAGESAERCVERLALAKAKKIWTGTLPVLGADTAVVLDGAAAG